MPVHPLRNPRPWDFRLPGGLLALPLLLAVLPAGPSPAASALLESVKENPALARSLCERFKQFNAQGKSATSAEAVSWVASTQGLSPVDAEVLSTYVIGLHCPDVR
ncbi:MAG: hypothetical protein ACKOZW_14215 [Cyanobium sp.]